MRIISGNDRGRKFEAPPEDITRPISDRSRESIFNMLSALGGVADWSVLDLYAGSGSFGLECLSRGANHVEFVEKSAKAVKVLNANITHLRYDNCSVQTANAFAVAQGHKMVDLAFCDPPYKDNPWPELLELIDAKILVGHAESDIELPERWEELKRRKYGRNRIFIAKLKD